jgi:branched-chain amino acid transport system ATP-binding protein
MLELVSVSAGYGESTVLHDVSLRVDTGTLVALVGANAAGKSTIARVISGLVPLKSGEVRQDGASIDGIRAHERVRQGIVHVPEGRRLFPLLSVEETLVSASSFGMPRARRAANLERVYALFPKLSERRTQLSSTMSGGEQQMLAIGRGLMSEPRFFILDEPSLGLAPKIVEQIFEVTRTLLEQKLTILLIEQHVKNALALCNYAYVVENGRILLEGSGRDVMSDDRMREAYLGKRHRDETARRS